MHQRIAAALALVLLCSWSAGSSGVRDRRRRPRRAQKPSAVVDDAALVAAEERDRRVAHPRPHLERAALQPARRRSTTATSASSASPGTFETGTDRGLEATPLVVDGVMYTHRLVERRLRASTRAPASSCGGTIPQVPASTSASPAATSSTAASRSTRARSTSARSTAGSIALDADDRQGGVAGDDGRSDARPTRSPARRASSRAR